MCWICFGYVLDMFWTCFRHVLDMFWICFGYVLDMFWTCFGHVWEMFGTCLGHVLDMFWTFFGHVLDMIGSLNRICNFVMQFVLACFFETNYFLFDGRKPILEEICLFWAKQLFIFHIRWPIF